MDIHGRIITPEKHEEKNFDETNWISMEKNKKMKKRDSMQSEKEINISFQGMEKEMNIFLFFIFVMFQV